MLSSNELKQRYEENKDLVTLKESVRHPGLFVLKYRKKVFFEGLWDDFLEEARGLVVDKDFNVIIRPFKKIYNYGIEKEAPVLSDETKIRAYRKINGFMLAVSTHDGKAIVSTTGSLDSDFVTYGEEMLKYHEDFTQSLIQYNNRYTYLFECVHPKDPHIVEEKQGLYFLGARNIVTGELFQMGSHTDSYDWNTHVQRDFGFNVVEYDDTTLGKLKETVKTVKHEGFVFYTEDGRSSKIKSPHYLTKKMLMRKNMNKIMSMDAKEFLDEEFYPLIDHVRNVDTDFFNLDEMEKREYIEDWFAK